MWRFLRAAILVGTILSGMLLVGSLSGANVSVRADVQASIHPTVAIDHFGKPDQELGFETHWECITNAAIPTDPFTCTRTMTRGINGVPLLSVSAAPQDLGWVSSLPPDQAVISVQPFTTTVRSCAFPGGTKIFSNINLGGNCAEFIGIGTNINLQTTDYPSTGTSVGKTLSSLSTLGSAGSGDFTCGNMGQYNFASNSQYNSITTGCADSGYTLNIAT